jgi:hypothetical protein
MDDLRIGIRLLTEAEMFLLTTLSRLTLGLTQPPAHWAWDSLPAGIKPSGRTVNHCPLSSTDN